jgi:hypothetical protein
MTHNKQLQRTVTRRRRRGACASLHYAHAALDSAARRRSTAALGDTVRGSYLLTLLLPLALGRAEVMDKEPSLTLVLGVVIAGAVGAFFASRYRPWLLGVVLLVVGVFFAGQYAELLDPAVGPAIRREAGILYVLMSWSGLFIAGAVIGLLIRRRHQVLIKTQ